MKLILSTLLCLCFSGCSLFKDEPVKISGAAQGTTYHITYFSRSQVNYKKQIDSLLSVIDLSLSTYVPGSVISRINNNDSTAVTDHYFQDVFKKSMEISEKTGGLFDVTVGPLINAWGFGPGKKSENG